MIWTTSTGAKISLSQMSDSHLQNSIKLYKRQIFSVQSDADMTMAQLPNLNDVAISISEYEYQLSKMKKILVELESELESRKNKLNTP
jgi:predicted Zn-dependent peptidase